MTALTGAAAPPAAGWRPRLWARAVRGTWISHRGALIALAAATVVLAVLIAVPATWANATDPKAALACVGHPVGAPCAASYAALARAHTWADLLGFALLLLPVAAGVFVGAPLVAREVESGSHRFFWTQGAGRQRFELRRLVLLVAAAAACACLLGLLMGWLVHPLEAAGLTSQWDARFFNSTVVALPAWTVFGLALGACVGALVRRAVPAMAVTAVAAGGLTVYAWEPATGSFGSLTTRILRIDPVAVRVSGSVLGLGGPGTGSVIAPPRSWVVRAWVTSPRGRRYGTETFWTSALARHIVRVGTPVRWLASHHFSNWYSYQPGERLWNFEGGLAAALVLAAVLLCWATAGIVRRLG